MLFHGNKIVAVSALFVLVISLFAIIYSVNQKNINEIKLWKTKYAQVSQYEEHLNEIEMGEMLEWQKENK